MYDKPEYPPLLPEGLHHMSLGELEELCVAAFPLSVTRSPIMDGFREVIGKIVECGMEGEIWVNGSFLTQKIDPADVDFCVMVPASFYDSGTDRQRELIDWLNRRDNEPKKLFRCDTVAEMVYPETSPYHYFCETMFEHWKRTYGRSVNTNEPKGIAVLTIRVTR